MSSSVMTIMLMVFFFNDTATTEIYTLSLHDALPIWKADLLAAEREQGGADHDHQRPGQDRQRHPLAQQHDGQDSRDQRRSEEHTSELQSRQYLVCRLLLEKKKK